MRLARLAVASALLIPAASASAADTIPLVALLTNSLAEGVTTMASGFGTGPVTTGEPGYYEAAYGTGAVKFLFDEPETCLVTLHVEMPGPNAADIRYDITRVTGITVEDRGKFEGLNAVVATLEGEDVVQVLMSDNWVTQPGFAFLVSSITLEQYQAAADELQRIC